MNQPTKRLMVMLALLCMALLAASCRRLPDAGPTPKPSITPTPRSTPLPPIPTDIPLGSTRNPLHLMMVKPQGDDQPSDSSMSDLQAALLSSTQMTVTVDLADADAAALTALCASPAGTVTAVWLSGVAYAAAYAQNCGTALLQVQRGSVEGDQAHIVVKSGSGLSAAADLTDHTFCRLSYTDLYSWLVPSLMLEGAGVSAGSLKSITDYDTVSALLGAVASGDCDAAGIAGSEFDAASASLRSGLRTLQQSVTIPYAVLVVPPELPLAQQQQLSDALIAIGNGTQSDLLQPLLQQDHIVAVTDSDLESLRSFISRAGIDLAQAGT